MPHARYTADGGTYRVGGQTFEPGDEHEVDRDVAEHLDEVDVFEVTGFDDTDEAADEDKDIETDGTLPFNPGSNTVGEIEEKLQDVDDIEAVQALRALEEEQENRTTAMEAIEDRLEELEG